MKKVEQYYVLTPAQAKKLGSRLRTTRKLASMSQLEVASESLGFDKSHAFISRLERAVLSTVPAYRIEAVSQVLAVPPSYLVGNKKPVELAA